MKVKPILLEGRIMVPNGIFAFRLLQLLIDHFNELGNTLKNQNKLIGDINEQ